MASSLPYSTNGPSSVHLTDDLALPVVGHAHMSPERSAPNYSTAAPNYSTAAANYSSASLHNCSAAKEISIYHTLLFRIHSICYVPSTTNLCQNS